MTRVEPVQARSSKRRLRILAAAAQVISDLGPDGRDRFTTGQVAAAAHCSIGTVYRYFEDRVDILNALYPDRARDLGEPVFGDQPVGTFTTGDGSQVVGVEIERYTSHVEVFVTTGPGAGAVSYLPLRGLSWHVGQPPALVEPPAPTGSVDEAVDRALSSEGARP